MADLLLYAELYDNPLTEKEGDFTAKPKVTGTVRNADIAKRIVAKRTEYRQETIENILRMADEEKSIAIAEGKSVIDGVGQYLVQIKGVFDCETEGFDAKKHSHFPRTGYLNSKGDWQSLTTQARYWGGGSPRNSEGKFACLFLNLNNVSSIYMDTAPHSYVLRCVQH